MTRGVFGLCGYALYLMGAWHGYMAVTELGNEYTYLEYIQCIFVMSFVPLTFIWLWTDEDTVKRPGYNTSASNKTLKHIERIVVSIGSDDNKTDCKIILFMTDESQSTIELNAKRQYIDQASQLFDIIQKPLEDNSSKTSSSAK